MHPLLCMNLGGKHVMYYLGYTTMTHGIKGELKFYTDFSLKEHVLKKHNIIYIDDMAHEITNVRPFKNFYILEIDNIKDINQVEDYRNKKVYFKKEDIASLKNEVIVEELIDFEVLEDGKKLGIIKEVMYNKGGILLRVQGLKSFYIPYQKAFIKEISLNEKKVYTQNAKGLIL